ncbi:MAG: hypothetical protein K6F84_04370 [Lachnospiraceae bacterium]|nr:hypothetical protein [Lachnospiraceae bacterium]
MRDFFLKEKSKVIMIDLSALKQELLKHNVSISEDLDAFSESVAVGNTDILLNGLREIARTGQTESQFKAVSLLRRIEELSKRCVS